MILGYVNPRIYVLQRRGHALLIRILAVTRGRDLCRSVERGLMNELKEFTVRFKLGLRLK